MGSRPDPASATEQTPPASTCVPFIHPCCPKSLLSLSLYMYDYMYAMIYICIYIYIDMQMYGGLSGLAAHIALFSLPSTASRPSGSSAPGRVRRALRAAGARSLNCESFAACVLDQNRAGAAAPSSRLSSLLDTCQPVFAKCESVVAVGCRSSSNVMLSWLWAVWV